MSDAEDTGTETGAVEIPGEYLPEVSEGSAEPGEDARPFPEEIEAPGGKEDSRRAKGSDAKDKNEGRSKGLGETEGRPPAASRCRPRSRDMRQCKKHFREMIGKYENRNDELEQRETDLRQRLDMLECSMPAVMVWNIWRMAQGAPVSQLREVVEKQFVEPGTGFGNCPSTPSQHWDCRVREIEAERKEARRRAEQARQVFRAKEEALQVQKRQVEEARKLQEERKLQIAGLEEEVKRLRDRLKKAQGDEGFCQTGECGEIKCRDAWLQGAASASSIHSTDLECLARLQDLAEAELCMKRQIAELERRECAYMRTLQQADEMWAKMEDENASSLGELREQLDAKVAANQQLADRIVELEDEIERLRAQLSRTSAALEEYTAKSLADVVTEDAELPAEVKMERTEEEAGEIEEAKPTEGSDEPEKPARQQSDAMVQATSEEAEPRQVGIESPSKISTTEESVQVEPEIEEAGTQLTPDEPGLENKNLAEEKARVANDADTAALEVPTKYSPKDQQEIAVVEEAQGIEAQEIELLPVQEKPRLFEDKASLAELLKAPTEDKVTEFLVPVNNDENNSSGKKEPVETTPGEFVELTQEVIPEPAVTPVGSGAAEPQPEPIVAKKVPSAAASFEEVPKAPFPTFPVHAASESPIGATEIAFPEPEAESTTETTASPVLVTAVEPVDAPTPKLETPEISVESSVRNVEEEFTLPKDTFSVSVGTLVAWHNVTACVKKFISICPRCSSSSNEVENMLKEIRNLLGKDAPILSEIECPESREGASNSVSVPQKKGPCICKPQTCPLEVKGAAVLPAAQSNVQVQTVVDGQSQTSTRSKIPSREIKSPRTSRGSAKTKEEVKLRSIEEGTETDPGIERARSIPEARDEATATVGDIASQTEGVRRVPSGADKEEKEKTCVCPTGVCPKKNPRALSPCGECKPEKSCTVGKKSLSKEYRSTAEAILAPAIKVLPSREGDSSPPVTRAKINNDTSSESRSACCVCGKPVSPVASMKITSASTAGKSFFHSGVVSLKSEISDDDFLCCACKAQALPKSSLPGRSSKKSVSLGRVKSRGKPTPGSCSRDVCCPCDDVEEHVITKPLNESSEVPKAKIKPETKDVCCLAKISRDKVMRTEGRKHRDKDSKSKPDTPNISVHSCSAQISATSSSFKTPKTNESSDSNFCCSSIEQVLSMTKKKKKSTRCACASPEGKDKKDECVCGENDSPIPKEPPKIKQSESAVSCLCSPPKLFDDH